MAEISKNSQTTGSASNSVSLLGCGWLGIALAPALQKHGLLVRGSTTRAAKLATLSSLGIEPHLLRIESQERPEPSHGHNPFFDSETLVLNLPPETAFGPDYHPGQLREIFAQLTPRMQHLLYVSSTAVYGHEQGEVDETTPPQPDTGSGEILIACETLLRSEAQKRGFALTIVRSAGLIGPGRHPGLFLAGRKEVRDAESPVNLIHQSDLVQILTALITTHAPRPGDIRVFNAVAPDHPPRKEFYTRVSAAVGVDVPQFAVTGVSKARPPTGKIIRGQKVIEETGLRFTHGDLYSGLGLKK